MARGGYKFFDTDAHVGPYIDVLEPYLTADDKARLAAWEQYPDDQQERTRVLQQGPADLSAPALYRNRGSSPAGYMAGFTGVNRGEADFTGCRPFLGRAHRRHGL